MDESDVNEAKNIWLEQYRIYCSDINFPSYWGEDSSILEKFLSLKVKNRNAIVAKIENKVVGYLSYDEFPFHGEKSVFCPAIAHSAIEEMKEIVYSELYKYISKQWVYKNVLNHMWTIFYNDQKLKTTLFDLGFGSYLIDAVRVCNGKDDRQFKYDIKKATLNNVNNLYQLVKESQAYYASAPLFLKRDDVTCEDIEELIRKNGIFIAWDKGEAVGFINVSTAEHNNSINLTVINSGLLDEIGAYIKLDYRSRGLGIELLEVAKNYCHNTNAPYIHVDFETANLYANKFWKNHLTPMLHSMRRTINKDINDR